MAEMFAAWETHRRIILGRIPCLVSSPQEFDFDLRSFTQVCIDCQPNTGTGVKPETGELLSFFFYGISL
jgi:hypothetical protein